jgi:hypothetical protein
MKKATLPWFVLAMFASSAPLVLGQNLATGRSGNVQQIVGSEQKLKYEGVGKDFEIVGHDDEIIITGECSKLEIGWDWRVGNREALPRFRLPLPIASIRLARPESVSLNKSVGGRSDSLLVYRRL